MVRENVLLKNAVHHTNNYSKISLYIQILSNCTGFMDRDKPNIFSNRYVDTRKPGQGFLRLMFVWHGSVFKLIWPHLLAFIVVYSLLSILYRNIFLTNEVQREWFELICVYASRYPILCKTFRSLLKFS